MNHYERLKVSRDAPLEVIRAAYRALAAKHHPDRISHTRPDAPHADMAALNSAYETLANPVTRAAYDAELNAQAAEPAIPPKRRYSWRGGNQDTNDRAAPEQFQPTQFQSTQFQSSVHLPPDAQDSRVDVSWLTSPPPPPLGNPWLARKRLVPVATVMGVITLTVGGWWAHLTINQMEAERTLSTHYDRQMAPSAIALQDVVAPPQPPSVEMSGLLPTGEELLAGSAPPPSKLLSEPRQAPGGQPARVAARHPLDGTPLGLRTDLHLLDPLAAAQP